MHIKYDKQTRLLEPFVSRGLQYIKSVWRKNKKVVKVYSFPRRSLLSQKWIKTSGHTTYCEETKTYTIGLLMWAPYQFKLRPIRLSVVLEVLAHEMAHLVCWNHDGDHMQATGDLLVEFGDELDRIGIKESQYYRAWKELEHYVNNAK